MSAPHVFAPEGNPLSLPPPADSTQSVSDWLNANGFPLNTRCGGRGLCRGCTILINGREEKACRIQCGSVFEADITLPSTSRQDATMQGITAFELEPNILSCSPLKETHGLALDLGTTTLAGALWRGNPPLCISTASVRNPQFRLGDNVVSRVQHAVSTESGAVELQNILIQEGIRPLLNQLGAGKALKEITISGNPVMLHLLAGESVAGFAAYPFKPAFLNTRTLDPQLLGLEPGIRITLLPGLGPFVGSDISAGAVACGLLNSPSPTLFMDFGTNGEILLKTEKGYFATATAAGPAFEGGRLKCGSTGGTGVIGSLGANLALPETGGPWHGIAGSAYVDAMAIGYASGYLTASGRFTQGPEIFQIAPNVEITEADIAELLQAKAALQAGWRTLCEVAEIHPAEIKSVIVAGGFGYHLQPTSAIAVGLIPPVNPAHVRLVGNSSLGGASLSLIQPDAIQQISDLQTQTQIIELNLIEEFEDHYIDALML